MTSYSQLTTLSGRSSVSLGTYIVDTGFGEQVGRECARDLKPIDEGLKAIGVDPNLVEHVVVTHMHYDHAGNFDLFPRARYHLQDTEMEYVTGRCMCHPLIQATFEVDDVVAMVRNVFSGRVAFHDGEDALAPGISLHRIGGHSRGLQCVRVKTRRGDVVLT